MWKNSSSSWLWGSLVMVMKRDEREWHLTVRAGSGLGVSRWKKSQPCHPTGNYSEPSQLNFLGVQLNLVIADCFPVEWPYDYNDHKGESKGRSNGGNDGGQWTRMSLSPINRCLSAMAVGWRTRFQGPMTSFTLCPTCLYVFEMRRVDASAAATKSARQKEEAAVPFYATSLWVRERYFIGEVTLALRPSSDRTWVSKPVTRKMNSLTVAASNLVV